MWPRITTQPPLLTKAHSIPAATQHRLGLGDKPSWIITNELNSFTWVGPDVERTASGEYIYGALPVGLVRKAQQDVMETARSRQLKLTARDDQALLERVRRIKTPSSDDDRER